MTSNQIAYWKLMEEHRTHKVGEEETHRHNVETEKEAIRANTLNAETSKRNVDVQAATQSRNTEISAAASRYGAEQSAGASTYGSSLNYQVGMANVQEAQRHNEAQERISLGTKIMDFGFNVAKWLVPTMAH